MDCSSPVANRTLAGAVVSAALYLAFGFCPSLVNAQGAVGPHAQAAGMTAMSAVKPVSGGWHYMVRSGDTLDRIIAQTQAASPFSIAFLRDAFARVNPTALPKGPKGPLIAGTLLRIPDSAELRRIAFPELETPVAPDKAVSEVGVGAATAWSSAQREELERRAWIRFP